MNGKPIIEVFWSRGPTFDVILLLNYFERDRDSEKFRFDWNLFSTAKNSSLESLGVCHDHHPGTFRSHCSVLHLIPIEFESHEKQTTRSPWIGAAVISLGLHHLSREIEQEPGYAIANKDEFEQQHVKWTLRESALKPLNCYLDT